MFFLKVPLHFGSSHGGFEDLASFGPSRTYVFPKMPCIPTLSWGGRGVNRKVLNTPPIFAQPTPVLLIYVFPTDLLAFNQALNWKVLNTPPIFRPNAVCTPEYMFFVKDLLALQPFHGGPTLRI